MLWRNNSERVIKRWKNITLFLNPFLTKIFKKHRKCLRVKRVVGIIFRENKYFHSKTNENLKKELHGNHLKSSIKIALREINA